MFWGMRFGLLDLCSDGFDLQPPTSSRSKILTTSSRLPHSMWQPPPLSHHLSTAWACTWAPSFGHLSTLWCTLGFGLSYVGGRSQPPPVVGGQGSVPPGTGFCTGSPGVPLVHSPPSTRRVSIGVPARPILTSHMAWHIKIWKWPARNAHHAPGQCPTKTCKVTARQRWIWRCRMFYLAPWAFPRLRGRKIADSYSNFSPR